MQDTIDRASVVELSPDVRFRAVCGDGVVLNQALAEVLVVNPVGLRVLELMKDEGAVAAILDRLLDEYEVEDAALEADVFAFLGAMVEAGAVRLRDGSSAP